MGDQFPENPPSSAQLTGGAHRFTMVHLYTSLSTTKGHVHVALVRVFELGRNGPKRFILGIRDVPCQGHGLQTWPSKPHGSDVDGLG